MSEECDQATIEVESEQEGFLRAKVFLSKPGVYPYLLRLVFEITYLLPNFYLDNKLKFQTTCYKNTLA